MCITAYTDSQSRTYVNACVAKSIVINGMWAESTSVECVDSDGLESRHQRDGPRSDVIAAGGRTKPQISRKADQVPDLVARRISCA